MGVMRMTGTGNVARHVLCVLALLVGTGLARAGDSDGFHRRVVPESEAPPPVIGDDAPGPPASPLPPAPPPRWYPSTPGAPPNPWRPVPPNAPGAGGMRSPFPRSSFPDVAELFDRMDRAFDQMDRFFGSDPFFGVDPFTARPPSGSLPDIWADRLGGSASMMPDVPGTLRVTFEEKEDRYEVEVDGGGAGSPKVRAQVMGDVLRISGSLEVEEREEGGGRSSSSRAVSRFEEVHPLPGPVDAAGMEILPGEGKVVIRLPKAPPAAR